MEMLVINILLSLCDGIEGMHLHLFISKQNPQCARLQSVKTNTNTFHNSDLHSFCHFYAVTSPAYPLLSLTVVTCIQFSAGVWTAIAVLRRQGAVHQH